MEQKGGPAPVRAEFTEKVQKKLWIWSGFDSFVAPFLHFLEDVFLMFFGARFIRVFFACGAQSSPRPPKMEAKWSRNSGRGHLVECARTMVFTVREAYREVWGRLREPTFYKPRRLTLPGGASERILADMERFGCPQGCGLGIKM